MSTATLTFTSVLESQHVVRERTFATRDYCAVIDLMHAEHATGQIIIDVSQGTVGTVRVREQLRISPNSK